MGANIDHTHPDVRRDLFHWIEWLGLQLNIGGIRFDAIKHFSASFLRDLIVHIDKTVGKGQDWFMVGEYWRDDAIVLAKYIEYMHHRISLFDVPLLENFSAISTGLEPDLRKVFDGTLAVLKPGHAVVSLFPITSTRPHNNILNRLS